MVNIYKITKVKIRLIANSKLGEVVVFSATSLFSCLKFISFVIICSHFLNMRNFIVKTYANISAF